MYKYEHKLRFSDPVVSGFSKIDIIHNVWMYKYEHKLRFADPAGKYKYTRTNSIVILAFLNKFSSAGDPPKSRYPKEIKTHYCQKFRYLLRKRPCWSLFLSKVAQCWSSFFLPKRPAAVFSFKSKKERVVQ